jgi:hypothetical protein
MSDSRAVLLKLSVRDADVVRQQLVAMGEQGARALNTLDAAARRTAGTAGAGGRTGGGGSGMGGLSSTIGQAGFQLQDFVVQVQSGTSALTALSQQGSQFLGAFGAGGAAAGAVLTVGLLATQFLLGSQRAEELRKVAEEGFRNTGRAAEDLKKVLEEVNELFLTQEQRASAASMATRANLLNQLRQQQSWASQMLEGSAMELPGVQRDLAAAERNLARLEAARARGASSVQEGDMDRARERVFDLRARQSGLQADIGRQSSRLGTIGEAINRTELNQGYGEYGPPRPTGGSGGGGAARTDTNGVRATLDDLRAIEADRERLIRESETAYERYGRRIQEIERIATQARENGNPIPDETIQRATASALADFERVKQSVTRTTEAANGMGRELGMTFSSAFEDAIVKGKNFRDVLAGIAQDIARMITRQAITTPLGNALNSAVGNIFGGNGGSFDIGKAVSYWTGGGFGGAKAEGGPVAAGMTYLVGERGPELFTPGASGNITPNHALGGATFAPTYNIDARGADPSMLPRLRAEMSAIAQASVAQFAEAINRGGSAARLVGRR